MTGPLARYNLNFDKLPAVVREIAAEIGLMPPILNPFRSIQVRALELIFACDEALRLIHQYTAPALPAATVETRAGRGMAATEAPRGLLYHRYSIDDRGQVLTARIVPPTAQNLKRIEDDLWAYLPQILSLPNEQIALRAEQAIRNYDPCISCATHFLKFNRIRG
jgi:coenzyme F420-reducing hydrogenase alpha subunit